MVEVRKTAIKLVTFLGGIYFFLKFVLPETVTLPGIGALSLGAYNGEIATGLTALAAMALGLGLINLIARHGGNIIYRRGGMFQSVALLTGLIVMLVLSGLEWKSSLQTAAQARAFFVLKDFSARIISDAETGAAGVPLLPTRLKALQRAAVEEINKHQVIQETTDAPPLASLKSELAHLHERSRAALEALPVNDTLDESLKTSLNSVGMLLQEVGAKTQELRAAQHGVSPQKQVYTFFFQGIFVSLGSAMFSLLGFYIASAAYRAFRVRSLESGLMMGAALLVILGQIPFMLFGSGPLGEELHHLFPRIRLWLLTVPNTAAFRAIEIGAAVGALVMAFRMWFSIEATPTFKRGEE